MKIKKKSKAFTLAEVLITLTIIGVIAALTVPALVQKTNKQEYVSALQKAYSTLSQATNMIIAENGSPKCDDGGWACSADDVYNKFKKYLINAKDCGSGEGCFENGGYKYLRKNAYGGNWNTERTNGSRKLVLADGVQIFFEAAFKDCSKEAQGSNNTCAWIFADINGAKKPNIFGKDGFYFVLKENGLFPDGCDDETFCMSDKSGWGCACKVIREGKMDY